MMAVVASRGWVGPLIGLVVCLLLLFLLVPLFTGIAHTLLQIIFIIGAVVCAILVVMAFVGGRHL
jgi:hypothetical protein